MQFDHDCHIPVLVTCSAHRLFALALLVAAGCSTIHRTADDDVDAGPDAAVSPCGPQSPPPPDASTADCCNDGLYDVHAPDRIYSLRITGCGAEWHCGVDGVERQCGIGHGTLLLRFTDDFSGPGLQLAIYECIGDSATGYYDNTSMFGIEVPVCRVDPLR